VLGGTGSPGLLSLGTVLLGLGVPPLLSGGREILVQQLGFVGAAVPVTIVDTSGW
jgi:hypothetical protein